jgi:hypothetical protein
MITGLRFFFFFSLRSEFTPLPPSFELDVDAAEVKSSLDELAMSWYEIVLGVKRGSMPIAVPAFGSSTRNE